MVPRDRAGSCSSDSSTTTRCSGVSSGRRSTSGASDCDENAVRINGRKASADGPIKTFSLRGIKDSPPYLHDGRLLTLDDTVEFFNLILETQLTADEKKQQIGRAHV